MLDIKSHLTAIPRTAPSIPLSRSLKLNLIQPKDRILDYGCGHGFDVNHLTQNGYNACGYDLWYQPKLAKGKFDFVLCSYVINVIADQWQRLAVLETVKNLSRRGVAITARSKIEVDRAAKKGKWKVYEDGYLTPRNTFQRGYELLELHGLLKDIGLEPEIAVGTPNYIYVYGAVHS